MRKLFALLLAFLAMFSITAPVFACEPPPTKPPSSKYINCDDLGGGYQFGFGVVGANNGTYKLTRRYGVMIGGAPEDGSNTIRISGSNGRVFDWVSSQGIDAVIVHAGGKSTVRKLNESRSGDDFYGQVDRYRRPYKVEGISFCYDYELSVTTSSSGTFKSAGEWSIAKTVDTPLQSRFAGETAPFNYTVALSGTEGGGATGFTVTTNVTIENNTPVKTYIKTIKNYLPAWNKWPDLDCGNVRFPYTLKPGNALQCTATTPVSSQRDGKSVVGFISYGLEGGAYESEIEWSGSGSGGGPTGAVTVTDTNAAFGGPYTVTAPQQWTYPVSLSCPSDPASYTDGVFTTRLDNVAQIEETKRQASQSVDLNCYAPVITGSGEATYDVSYVWDITKTSPITNLSIPQNETRAIDYNVVVSVIDEIATNYQTTGSVEVHNPNPVADMTVSLLDANTQAFPAGLTGCANPQTIPAGGSVTCQYAADPENETVSGPIQVVMNDIVFGSVNPEDFTATPGNEVDECVTVYDDAFGEPLGEVCADEATASYAYDVTVGPFAECYDTDYTNTAYFIANDTEASDYANWQVLINVICTEATNCTYNRTYWMARADTNPEIYNVTWNQVGGPSAPFFGTGLSWIEMLSTEGTGVYDQLAREYIVGRLNVLRGAQADDYMLSMLDHAASLLEENAASRDAIDPSIQWDFSDTQYEIMAYNTGITGPGVCPDCTLE